MKPIEFSVIPALQNTILKIMYVENNSDFFGFRTIPRNFPGLFFSAPEDGFMRIRIGLKNYYIKGGGIYFAGIGYEPSEMFFHGNLKIWVVMLQPYATETVFRESPCAFVNQAVSVHDVNASFSELNEKLWTTHLSLFEMVELIQKYFLDKLDKQKLSPAILRAFQEINQTKGTISMNDLADKTYTCNRNLLRQFYSKTGVNPKKYCAMVRFSWMIKELVSTHHVEIEDLLLQYGYYDYSHFHKEAVRFLGNSLKNSGSWNSDINQKMI